MRIRLAERQLDSFSHDGFLVLPQAVPPEQIAAARAAIDDALASDRSIGRLTHYLSNSFCPDTLQDPRLLALFENGPFTATEALFGASPRIYDVQVALRFPEERTEPGQWPPHIDGFPSGLNSISVGQVDRQTAVVGVYLTRAEQPNMGNLAVWPGSHRRLAARMASLDAPSFLARHGAERLHAEALAQISADEPMHLTVEPGDAIVCHHLLAHSAAWNLSLHTRYAVYFRVLHPNDDPSSAAALTDVSRFFESVCW